MENALTFSVIFAALIAYHYIRDLRRARDKAEGDCETAWRLYEKQANEMRALQGLPPHTESFFDEQPKPTRSGFRPAAIGPTAILARELQRERDEERASADPPFDNPGVLGVHPTLDDIAKAAREAAGNGKRR